MRMHTAVNVFCWISICILIACGFHGDPDNDGVTKEKEERSVAGGMESADFHAAEWFEP